MYKFTLEHYLGNESFSFCTEWNWWAANWSGDERQLISKGDGSVVACREAENDAKQTPSICHNIVRFRLVAQSGRSPV